MKYLALFGREKGCKEIMMFIYKAFGIDQPYQKNVLILENLYQIIKITIIFVNNVLANNYGIKDLKQILTPKEIKYFQNDCSEERERIDYLWCYEHLYLLEWALGLAEWNYPDNICDIPFTVRVLKTFDSIEDLCEKTVLRSKKEILDMADLVYRMDWAAVDARIHRMTHGMIGPAGLEHGVVQARHKTLNWLIGFNDEEWYEVSTPT